MEERRKERGNQGEGRKELSRKRVPLWEGGGMARFSQAANMLSRFDDDQPNNVMAALYLKSLYATNN